MILLLSKKNAEERLAALYLQSVPPFRASAASQPREFRLTMTRGDIGNYLGLT
ncbi:transcriptional regulation of aerobic, anaerobic respiration, osmotic balance [Klebsiella michiganensis]|uniref:Transcriptional regulation of aerobic, anaerobic respiration, osmotic balance n=1 Tax=Klebsiella michiganensis TaxID=1134687 RepID=A0A7H4PLY7_9ENTR|nr:transcriptional regulation of aerobic, anaerobic respiration, osmotic balance [Klebsiella michiganensis]